MRKELCGMARISKLVGVRGLAVVASLALCVMCCGCDGDAAEDHAQEQTAPIAIEQEAEEAVAGDEAEQNMFTGTCRILNVDELLELQGYEGDASLYEDAADNRYAVIVADHMQSIYAHHASDPDYMIEEERDLVCVAIEGAHGEGDVSQWEPYDGRQVTVYLDPDTTWYPSDARLPLGTPHTKTATLVSVE